MWRVRYGSDVLYDPRDPDLALAGMDGEVALNEAGRFEFSMPPGHPFSGRIDCLQKDVEIVVEQDGDTVFCGRAMWEKPDFHGNVVYTCEGERAYLNDVSLPPYTTAEDGKEDFEQAPTQVDALFSWYVTKYNAKASPCHRFIVGVNEGAALDANNRVLRESSQRPSVWAEIKEKIVDSLGGYVRVRHESGLRYIDLLADGGKACAQRIEFGVNLLDYARERSYVDYCTRVVPVGEDDDGNEVTIASIPDGPLQAGYEKDGEGVVSVEGKALYGIVEKTVKFEAATPEGLLQAGLRNLVNRRVGDTLELTAVDLHQVDAAVERIELGSYVRATSKAHGLDEYFLCCRLPFRPGEPGGCTYTLGSTYDTLTGRQSSRIAALNAGINKVYDAMAPIDQAAKDAAKKAQEALDALVDLRGAYVHIMYSASLEGAGMTPTPQPETAYIGICTDDAEAAPTDPALYTWSKIKGEDGVQGRPGEDGTPSYVHVKWSENADGAGMSETPGPYMGTCVDAIEADPTDPALYTWVRVKGDQGDPGIRGLQGEDGEQGIQGPPGADGRSSYTHVAYANSADGTEGFSVSDSDRAYIGVCVDEEPRDSADPADYAWTLVKGADGANGTPGKPGADGRTPYLHIAYANSADGAVGFSVSSSADKAYIGQYTDFAQADSTIPSKYSWTLIKGEKGDKGEPGIPGGRGADGKTYYTWLKYADTPTSGMSDDPAGKSYIGMAYNKAMATESTVYADYTWSLIKGEKGDQGIPGGKGADGKTYYTWVKYATSASGAGMSDSPAGKTYIGLAYNKTTATESANPADYAWSLIKGDKGDRGDTGAAGKGIASNAVAYQAGASGTTAPTGAWQATVPAVAASQYLWTRFVVTYTDSTTSTAYSVGKMGANGSPGSPGAAGKGVKSTAVSYQSSASATTAPTGTWAASPPTAAAGQYLWTRFVMTYTDNTSTTAYSIARQGADGANGAAGKPGADGADGKTLYGACNTAAATAAKVPASTIAGFSLYVGASVSIKFTYANSAAAPTLNVNGTGAKQIRLNGANSAYWVAGSTVAFVHDGTYWQVCNTPLYGSTSTIGNPAGANVYTDGSSVSFRTGSTVLAKIAASLVELGKNSLAAVVSMCGGRFRIAGKANSVYGEGMTLESTGDLTMSAGSGRGSAGDIYMGVLLSQTVHGYGIKRESGVTEFFANASKATLNGKEWGSSLVGGWQVVRLGNVAVVTIAARMGANAYVSNQWGSLWESGAFALPDYPVAFASVPWSSVEYVSADGGYDSAAFVERSAATATAKNPGSVYLVRPSSATIGHPVFAVVAIGTV